MDMIDFLYKRNIKGVPLIIMNTIFEDPENYIFKAGNLFVKYNNKIIPLGCIKDIYADPNTGKKASFPKISNPCLNIMSIFNVNCSTLDCINCHKQLASKAFSNEIKLLK